jgi:polyhydroxybutyrate depolymerase
MRMLRSVMAPVWTAMILTAGCAADGSDAEVVTGAESAATPAAQVEAPPVEETPTTPRTCSGRGSLRTGDTTVRLTVGGQARTFLLHVPASYKGDAPVPLLLDWHPMLFGTSQSHRGSSGYAQVADREGFLVAFPQGLDNAWNMGPCCTRSRATDDFGFALAIVEKIKADACIDEKRVYSAGYSNGGGLSHYLACKHADVFAAVSPAAFDLIQEVPCKPSRPISVISYRGTSDFIVPYAGGRSTPPTPYPLSPINFLGAEGTFKKWAEINGCTGTPTTSAGGCRTYPQCKDGVEVTLCTAQGGGHSGGPAAQAWERLKKYTLP